MKIMSILYGSMPRSRRLARALSRYYSQKISLEALDEIYRKELKRYIDFTLTYNFFRVSDGMFRWDDLFNPLAEYMKIPVNGLKRFYDNNFFFRQPVFKEKIRYETPVISEILTKDLKLIGSLDKINRISISLPGPATLVANSLIEGSSYTSTNDLARDYIEKVVLKEAENAYKQGFRHIDLHEPELASENVKADDYIDLYKRVSEYFRGFIWIPIYFGYNSHNIKILAEELRDTNIILIIDLVTKNIDIERLRNDLSKTKAVGVGLINSRNTKMEKIAYIREYVATLEKTLSNIEDLYLTHNTNLEFLPEKVAYKKIRLLSKFT